MTGVDEKIGNHTASIASMNTRLGNVEKEVKSLNTITTQVDGKIDSLLLLESGRQEESIQTAKNKWDIKLLQVTLFGGLTATGAYKAIMTFLF